MRIHRFVLIAVIVGLSAVVVRAATDADRVASKPKSSSPTTSSVTPSGDCCVEAVQTDFPIPRLSDGGNHCPSKRVPAGSSNLFDPESGRLEIDFYDVAYDRSRTFILDIRDADCFKEAATRQALFIELAVYLQPDTSEDGFSRGCERLKDAIRAGSLKLGEKPFDMRPAQPYLDEVCPTVRSA